MRGLQDGSGGGWGAGRGAGLGLRLAACACFILAGCASTPLRMKVHGAPLQGHPRVALLPLENLSVRPEAGLLVTRVVFAQLVRTGTCDVVESGEVDAALQDLRIINSGSLSNDQLQGIAGKLKVDLVLLGSLLEYGTTHATGGDIPSVGVALKLLDSRTGKVVWAAMDVRSGDDQETVFGWGRRREIEQLTAELTASLLEDFPALAEGGASGTAGGGRK